MFLQKHAVLAVTNSNLHESVFVEHPGKTQKRWQSIIAFFSFHKGPPNFRRRRPPYKMNANWKARQSVRPAGNLARNFVNTSHCWAVSRRQLLMMNDWSGLRFAFQHKRLNMYSIASIALFASICLSQTAAQVPGFGKCPNPEVQPDFQLASVCNNFFGSDNRKRKHISFLVSDWASSSCTDTVSRCTRLIYRGRPINYRARYFSWCLFTSVGGLGGFNNLPLCSCGIQCDNYTSAFLCAVFASATTEENRAWSGNGYLSMFLTKPCKSSQGYMVLHNSKSSSLDHQISTGKYRPISWVTITRSFLLHLQYLGTWYEIARFFAIFEIGSTCNTANYSILPNGHIRVLNSGIKWVPWLTRSSATCHVQSEFKFWAKGKGNVEGGPLETELWYKQK